MTTYKEFLEWTRERGARDQSGYKLDDDGRMYSILKITPPAGRSHGCPVFLIDVSLDDKISQLEILNAKRLLQLF